MSDDKLVPVVIIAALFAAGSCGAAEAVKGWAYETHRLDAVKACLARFTPDECKGYKP